MDLPAGTLGDEVSFIDYAGTFDSNNLTIGRNGTEKIVGSTDPLTVSVERAANTFMSDWTFAVMNEYPNFNIVGEEWSENPIVISYWQKDKINHDGYVSYLPTLMDFPLQISFTEALLDDFNWGKGFIKPYKVLASDFLYPNPNNLLIFPDNHDMARFYTQVKNDIDLFKMGIVYYSTMRGIPQFYYGTEILMNSDENPGDHGTKSSKSFTRAS